MAKYTEEDYVSKLLPESLAQNIIWDDLSGSEYMKFLNALWLDSREFLCEQRSEKEFLLSVMSQIDYFSNVDEYHQDVQAINENAITEDGKLDLSYLNLDSGFYYNVYLTRLYVLIRNCDKLTVRELFGCALYQRRTKLALWYVDTVCKNFGIEITQNGNPVDLKTAKLDSVVEIRRKSNK